MTNCVKKAGFIFSTDDRWTVISLRLFHAPTTRKIINNIPHGSLAAASCCNRHSATATTITFTELRLLRHLRRNAFRCRILSLCEKLGRTGKWGIARDETEQVPFHKAPRKIHCCHCRVDDGGGAAVADVIVSWCCDGMAAMAGESDEGGGGDDRCFQRHRPGPHGW
jgi:hypothetical protein